MHSLLVNESEMKHFEISCPGHFFQQNMKNAFRDFLKISIPIGVHVFISKIATRKAAALARDVHF